MDFGFSPEQDMLRQTARAFLADNCPTSLVRQLMEDERGYKPELWKDMADLGWLGLALFRFCAVSRSDDAHGRLRSPEKNLPPENCGWLLDRHAGHD